MNNSTLSGMSLEAHPRWWKQRVSDMPVFNRLRWSFDRAAGMRAAGWTLCERCPGRTKSEGEALRWKAEHPEKSYSKPEDAL